jgi:hypothetical protein
MHANLTSAGSDLGFLSLDGLSALLKLGNSLQTHLTTAPTTRDVVIELFLEVGLELSTLDVVLSVVVGESDNSAVLLVHKSSKTSLALNNAKRDIHLTAKSREPDNQLNRVNIMSDANHGGLLLLNECGDMLQAVLEGGGRGTGRGVLTVGSSGGSLLQSLNLGLLSLRLVLDKKLEKFGSLVLVESGGKLLKSRGDLQSLKKDLLLSLQTNIAWPSDKAGKITLLGQDVTTNSVASGGRREQRVGNGGLLHRLHLLGLGLRITCWHFD